jgi:hypothetical protein
MGSSLACPVPDIVVNIDQLKKKRRVFNRGGLPYEGGLDEYPDQHRSCYGPEKRV